MTLWRLEWLRLVRTHRWMIVLGAYLVFGIVGPLTAAYLQDIIGRFGGELTIIAPAPTPADGITQFIGNASQLGLLAVIVIGVAALAVDARPELAAFLRTRVPRPWALLLPRYVVTMALAATGLVAGTAVAWALTSALIGGLPVTAMLVGTAYGILYLAFAVAVLAAVSGFTRTQPTAVFATLAVLLVLPVLGLVPPIQPWLPSELLSAVAAMVDGVPASEFVRAAVTALVGTTALLGLATHRFGRREV
jgi:ABC-2 type transport system permease protein